MKKKGRKPSQVRYDRAYPTISFRLDAAGKAALEQYCQDHEISYADFIKESLGLKAPKLEKGNVRASPSAPPVTGPTISYTMTPYTPAPYTASPRRSIDDELAEMEEAEFRHEVVEAWLARKRLEIAEQERQLRGE